MSSSIHPHNMSKTDHDSELGLPSTTTHTADSLDMDHCPTFSDNSTPLPEISRLTRFRSSNNFLSFTIALAFFVDLLCYSIIMPLTPFIVERLGLKSTANGALIACYAIGLLVASPIAGVVSDRMANRRLPMIIGLLALLLSTVLFMEALNHFWVLLIARLLAGIAGGTVMTLGFAVLSDSYASNELGEQMGKVLIGQTLGLMAGPPLGGLLQEHVGVKAPYVFCLILIGFDLMARLAIIEPRSAKVKAIRKFQKEQAKEDSARVLDINDPIHAVAKAPVIKTSIWKLLANKRLLTALVVAFMQAFLIAALEPILPLYLAARFQLTETKIGVIFLALSIPTVVAPVAGWYSDKHGARYMCAVAIIISAILTIAMGIPGLPLWPIILFLVGIGATCAIYITPALGELSAVVRVTGDGDGFARAFALFNMVFSLGMVVGPLLGSLIYQETSMLWSCVLVGAISFALLPMVFLYMGDKAQKDRDQAQYEEDMQQQDKALELIHQHKQQQLEKHQGLGESSSAVDVASSVVVEQK